MVQAGKYLAQVQSHAVTQAKSGNYQVEVVFEIQDDTPMGAQGQTVRAWFSLSEKASPYTIQKLITMGLKGDDVTGDLDKNRVIEIVLQDKVKPDGQTKVEVAFVNPIGQIKNQVPQDLAKAKLAGLSGLVAKIRSESGDDGSEFGF